MIISYEVGLKSFADESYFGISNTSDDESVTLKSSCLSSLVDSEIIVDYSPETSLDLGIERKSKKQSTNQNPSIRGKISGHRSRRLRGKSDAPNPHDELLSMHYDRERIESLLDKAYPCENDSVETFGRLPLHEIIDDFSVEAQIKENTDTEDNWTSYQRYHLVEGLDMSNRVSTLEEKGIDPQYAKGPPLHDSEQHRTFQSDDDDRSINNAIATKNFVSAPRLLESTKSIPFAVQVQMPNNDKSNTSMKYLSTASFKAIGDFSVSRPRDPMSSGNSCGFKSKYIDDDKTRMSSSYCSNSTPWSRNYSTRSPIGVDHFDERRPWRKSKSRVYTAVKPNYEENFIHDNEEVIARLKFQVGNMIYENSLRKRLSSNLLQKSLNSVHPTCGSSIRSDLHKINSIKARRRELELQRVPSSSSHYTSAVLKRAEKERSHDQLKIQELKTRLRRIESTKTCKV